MTIRLRNPFVVVALLLSILPSTLALALPMDTLPHQVGRAFYEHRWLDEFCHSALFFVLTAFIYSGFRVRKTSLSIGMVMLAFATEGMQWFTGRWASTDDIICDVLGVMLFWLTLAAINEHRQERGMAEI
jgi:VanZ family protein